MIGQKDKNWRGKRGEWRAERAGVPNNHKACEKIRWEYPIMKCTEGKNKNEQVTHDVGMEYRPNGAL